MLDFLTKKKVKESKIADFFVETTLQVTEDNFSDVADLISFIPEFDQQPSIDHDKPNAFVLIVVVTNLDLLSNYFDPYQADRLKDIMIDKLAKVYRMSSVDFIKIINDYKVFLSRVNHPSKNKVYAMSKGMFHKYGLNDYQSSYFKKMNTPNPLLLKKIDEVMEQFLWKWDAFIDEYKIVNQ